MLLLNIVFLQFKKAFPSYQLAETCSIHYIEVFVRITWKLPDMLLKILIVVNASKLFCQRFKQMKITWS